jgi:hypothetical protein
MSVRLRPRTAWEALDLGLLFVRDNARALWSAWFAAYVPVAAVLLACFRGNLVWAWLVLWWLKPAFDRLVLAVLAPRVVGEAPALGAVLRAWPRTLWRSGILSALTYRRFDLARSFHLPVRQLERLAGRPARRRTAVLDRDGRGAAVWLTFVLANLEGVFALAASMLLALVFDVQTPVEAVLEGWLRGLFMPHTASLGGVAIGLAITTLLEPLYVASGFMLYLQRRTELEGWDIELRFRQMARRLTDLARPAAAAATPLAAIALAVSLAVARPAPAAQEEAAPAPAVPAAPAPIREPPRDPARVVREVLEDPVFGERTKVTRLKYVGPTWERREGPEIDFSWWKQIVRWSAQIARAAAWVTAACAIGFALYQLAKYLRARSLRTSPRARPEFLFGLDVRAGSLPDDVAGAAGNAARAGRVREALSLLYRGALVRFMDEGLDFRRGDTEGDCLARVAREAGTSRAGYFRRLVAAWQSLAYGHQAVDAAAALALATEWRDCFDAPPDGAGTAAAPQPA